MSEPFFAVTYSPPAPLFQRGVPTNSKIYAVPYFHISMYLVYFTFDFRFSTFDFS